MKLRKVLQWWQRWQAIRQVRFSATLDRATTFWSDQIEYSELRAVQEKGGPVLAPYSRLCEFYNTYLNGFNFLPIIEYYSNLTGNPKQSLLDLGCGTGRVTVKYGSRFDQVTGVDLSPEMISLAIDTTRDGSESPPTNVRFETGDFLQLNDQAPSIHYDWITCGSDAINYLLGEQELGILLQRVASQLKRQGFFVFDVIQSPAALAHFSRMMHVDISQHVEGKERFVMVARSRRQDQLVDIQAIFKDGIETHQRRAFFPEEIEEQVQAANLHIIDTFALESKFRRCYVVSPSAL